MLLDRAYLPLNEQNGCSGSAIAILKQQGMAGNRLFQTSGDQPGEYVVHGEDTELIHAA